MKLQDFLKFPEESAKQSISIYIRSLDRRTLAARPLTRPLTEEQKKIQSNIVDRFYEFLKSKDSADDLEMDLPEFYKEFQIPKIQAVIRGINTRDAKNLTPYTLYGDNPGKNKITEEGRREFFREKFNKLNKKNPSKKVNGLEDVVDANGKTKTGVITKFDKFLEVKASDKSSNLNNLDTFEKFYNQFTEKQEAIAIQRIVRGNKARSLFEKEKQIKEKAEKQIKERAEREREREREKAEREKENSLMGAEDSHSMSREARKMKEAIARGIEMAKSAEEEEKAAAISQAKDLSAQIAESANKAVPENVVEEIEEIEEIKDDFSDLSELTEEDYANGSQLSNETDERQYDADLDEMPDNYDADAEQKVGKDYDAVDTRDEDSVLSDNESVYTKLSHLVRNGGSAVTGTQTGNGNGGNPPPKPVNENGSKGSGGNGNGRKPPQVPLGRNRNSKNGGKGGNGSGGNNPNVGSQVRFPIENTVGESVNKPRMRDDADINANLAKPQDGNPNLGGSGGGGDGGNGNGGNSPPKPVNGNGSNGSGGNDNGGKGSNGSGGSGNGGNPPVLTKAKETQTDQTKDSADDSSLKSGYYERDYLKNLNFFGFDKSKPKTFVEKLNGYRPFLEPKKTNYLNIEEGGFVTVDYISEGSAVGALEKFQNDVQSYMQQEHPTLNVADNNQYNFTSFVKIKGNKGERRNFDNKDVVEDHYCIVNASNNAIDVNYVDERTFSKIENRFKSGYQDLLDLRAKIGFIQEKYNNSVKNNHEEVKELLASSFGFIDGKNSFSINSFDKAILENDIDKIEEFKNSYQNFLDKTLASNAKATRELILNGSDIIVENIKSQIDSKEQAKLLAFNNYKTSKEVQKESEISRKKNKQDVNLEEDEIEKCVEHSWGILKDPQEMERTTYLRHNTERDNYKKLLKAEIPGSDVPGIVVNRLTQSNENIKTWLRNSHVISGKVEEVRVDVATVLFNGKSDNNVMHLFIPNTEFYVKVKRNLQTNEVEIDGENVYSLNGKSGFQAKNIKELLKKDKNFETEFNNFQVKAVSYVDGQRHMQTLYNGKVNNHNLAKKISKDCLFDEEISPIKFKNENPAEIQNNSKTKTNPLDDDSSENEVDTISNNGDEEEVIKSSDDFNYYKVGEIKNGSDVIGYILNKVKFDSGAGLNYKNNNQKYVISVKEFSDFQNQAQSLKEEFQQKNITPQKYLEAKSNLYRDFNRTISDEPNYLFDAKNIKQIYQDNGVEENEADKLAGKIVLDSCEHKSNVKSDKVVIRDENKTKVENLNPPQQTKGTFFSSLAVSLKISRQQ